MEPKIHVAKVENLTVLQFRDEIRFDQCFNLSHFIEHYYQSQQSEELLIDLTQATFLDSTALGAIAQIAVHCKTNGSDKPVIVVNHEDLMQILKSVCFDQVFTLKSADERLAQNDLEFIPIKALDSDQPSLASAILKAHQQLMMISDSNEKRFKDVSQLLKKQTDKST